MTPLIIKSTELLPLKGNVFGFEIRLSENALYIPTVLAKAIPNYSEGGNAMPVIEAIWNFPRELAGALGCRGVGEFQDSSRKLVQTLADSKLLDPSSLPFWNRVSEKPTSPQPSLF